jgi:hypothetical protein
MNNQTPNFNNYRWLLMFSTILLGFLAAISVSATNQNPVADFDGDGKTDISVYRRSDTYWYVSKSSGGYSFIPWGRSNDTLVPGDYDGDGKTDLAVWRRGTPNLSLQNLWYILKSSDYTLTLLKFGGDETAYFSRPTTLADYDGDGKTDLVNISTQTLPNVGTYLDLSLSSGITYNRRTPLTSNDKVVSADYDGDGRADMATYRDGIWTIQQTTDSNGANLAVAFGLSSDKPLASDYDGDGKADIAVWRPSNGYWYWLSSRNGSFNSYQFGLREDLPVPADYDGDGKTDFAVFRPSNGTWYLQQSRDGFRADQFGLSDDVPIPSLFY